MSAEATTTFSVWLVQTNKVYRGVPYSVVCDWVQEGRLTAKDCVRTSAEANWKYVGDHDLFKAYLTMAESTPRAEDDAEALGDIEMDFNVRQEEEGDEDPDMIPLIDISMVLLVFFMMTAQDLLTSSPVSSPKAAYAEIADQKAAIMANMQPDKDNPKKILYFYGDDFKTELSEEGLVAKIAEEANNKVGQPTIILRADGTLPYEKVRGLTIALHAKIKGAKINGQVKEKPEAAP